MICSSSGETVGVSCGEVTGLDAGRRGGGTCGLTLFVRAGDDVSVSITAGSGLAAVALVADVVCWRAVGVGRRARGAGSAEMSGLKR